MKGRPFILPTSTRRSWWPASNASRARSGRKRSSPRSRAKWLSVPVGTTARGKLRSTATPATAATDPSPPATASDSAPSSAASTAACLASSPGSSTRTRIPRSRAALVRLPSRAAALPAAGLRIRLAEELLALATGGSIFLVRCLRLRRRLAHCGRAPIRPAPQQAFGVGAQARIEVGARPRQVGGAGSPQKGEQTLFHDRSQRVAVVVEDVNASQLHSRAHRAERNHGRDLQYRAILLACRQLQLGEDLLQTGGVRQIRR